MNKKLSLPYGIVSYRIALILGYVLIAPSLPATATSVPTPISILTSHSYTPKAIDNSKKTLIASFKYVRSKTADNGSPFPKNSGYIKGYPIQFTDGLSSVTVDNSRNSSDIFVKLYALDSNPSQAVRVLFIRAGKKFTAEKIKAGAYDVRFRDLNSGALARTNTFNLEEYNDFDKGTKFTRYILKLKPIIPTKKLYPLSEQEF